MKALIVGIGGQDGSYLTEHLLAAGYEVSGVLRPARSEIPEHLVHVADRVRLFRLDLHDERALRAAIEEAQPDEIYNLAGNSFVPDSWRRPATVAENTGLAVLRLLEAIRVANPAIRFYQASTSEMFGRPTRAPQDETTPFDPRNPYALAKLHGHLLVDLYRKGYGLFAVSGILYNHESPRRGLEFVTRKITYGAAAISLGHGRELLLGDISARRDWGFAGDYTRAMWLMLQQDEPRDYVIATGVLFAVRDVLEVAFGCVGLSWEDHVVVDLSLVRPEEQARLVGDATRAHVELGWAPTVAFEQLIELMVDADVARLAGAGYHPPGLDRPPAHTPYPRVAPRGRAAGI
jgi:GDPmannose 4,6-dehydratase